MPYCTFGEFERRYGSRLRNDGDPHAHHKLFMKLDKDGDLKLEKDEIREFPLAAAEFLLSDEV